MADPVAVGLGVAAAVVRVVGAVRKTLEHPGQNYVRYRQLTGFSMFTIIGASVALWVCVGALAFLLAMLAGQLISLALIKVYEVRLERDKTNAPVDRGLTELINGVSALLAVAAGVLAIFKV